MDEIQLSSDLNVITAEINSYKQVAGQSIFEIGRRLKHVKENDLVHGEWEKWCSETVEITPAYANRYIKVFEEFKGSNQYTSIGLNKLYQIATLPKEEREKEHITSKGESKTVDEMTVRELQEVKRQLKVEQNERERLEKENEILANQEPEKVEVVPDDYDELKGGYEAAQRLRDRYKEENDELRRELNELSDSIKKNSFDDSELQKLREEEERVRNKLKDYETLHDIQFSLEEIIGVLAPKIHSIKKENVNYDYEIASEFESILSEVINICEVAKSKLPNKNIIEGEIVDEI